MLRPLPDLTQTKTITQTQAYKLLYTEIFLRDHCHERFPVLNDQILRAWGCNIQPIRTYPVLGPYIGTLPYVSTELRPHQH